MENAEALNAFFISQTALADKDAAPDAAPDTGQLPKHSAKLNNLSTTAKKSLTF